MNKSRHLVIFFIALALLLGGMGITAQPAQAASCTYYHTVKSGQTLSWIGAYYDVPWRDIAEANDIVSPWVVYTGQKLCIPGYSGTTPVSYTPTWKDWRFTVVGVVKDTSVTIQTADFPDNMLYTAEIGCASCGAAAVKVADVDSGDGGKFKRVLDIPAAFDGVSRLWVRLTQVNNGDTYKVNFINATTYWYGGYEPDLDEDIPTITIVSVVRNSTVTIRTHNFPEDLTFTVRMGKMGSRGVTGYTVGTFDSGDGTSQDLTFNIPSELRGLYQIAIRTQNTAHGYYSYNWFYNSTAN